MQPIAPAADRAEPRSAGWLPVLSLALTVVAWLLIFTVPSDAPDRLGYLSFVVLGGGIVVGVAGLVSAVRTRRHRGVAILAIASSVLTAAFWFLVFWTVANSLTLTP